jgi:arylformamidase
MLHDITIAVHAGTPEWPGDTPYSCRWPSTIVAGSSVNVSAITLSPHVGTHADAPLHVRDGWAGAESLPLDVFAGRAVVADLRERAGEIETSQLDYDPSRDGPRLLLRTGRSIASGRFPDEWPVLSERCVVALMAQGLRLLGVDAPSVDLRQSKALAVHHHLFGGGGCVLENLDLQHVPAGSYELIAYPCAFVGLDAAPVRAVLRSIDA